MLKIILTLNQYAQIILTPSQNVQVKLDFDLGLNLLA
jgi:hypothetical protein